MSCLLWRAGTGTSAVEAGVVVVVVAVVVSVPLVSVGLSQLLGTQNVR